MASTVDAAAPPRATGPGGLSHTPTAPPAPQPRLHRLPNLSLRLASSIGPAKLQHRLAMLSRQHRALALAHATPVESMMDTRQRFLLPEHPSHASLAIIAAGSLPQLSAASLVDMFAPRSLVDLFVLPPPPCMGPLERKLASPRSGLSATGSGSRVCPGSTAPPHFAPSADAVLRSAPALHSFASACASAQVVTSPSGLVSQLAQPATPPPPSLPPTPRREDRTSPRPPPLRSGRLPPQPSPPPSDPAETVRRM